MIDEKNPFDSVFYFFYFVFIFLLKVGLFLYLKLDPLPESEPELRPGLIGSVAALLTSSGSADA